MFCIAVVCHKSKATCAVGSNTILDLDPHFVLKKRISYPEKKMIILKRRTDLKKIDVGGTLL